MLCKWVSISRNPSSRCPVSLPTTVHLQFHQSLGGKADHLAKDVGTHPYPSQIVVTLGRGFGVGTRLCRRTALVRRTGVSSGTANAIRQEQKAVLPLYRNTEFGDCVPLACRDGEDDYRLPETLGEIGGPGRIRTDDNTVMSGAF